jgi:plastocyanin
MKRFLLAFAVLGTFAACKGQGILSGEDVLKAQNAITVNDRLFSPASFTMQAGDPLVFNWFANNTVKHEIHVTGPGGFDQSSPNQANGDWTVTLPTPGVYTATDVDVGFSATITVVAKAQ